jgi:hypothetical protein
MPTITVPIIAQSTTTPPVFYGMIGTLTLVLDVNRNYISGNVLFTKPALAQGLSNLNTSKVGQTPIVQNGQALQFQLLGADASFSGAAKSMPNFTFTGQLNLDSQGQLNLNNPITGQAAWLPQSFLDALALAITTATGDFTQSPATFVNPPPNPPSNPPMLSLGAWTGAIYDATKETATGLQGGTTCDLQLYVPSPPPPIQNITLYLNMKGGTSSCPLNMGVWQTVANQPPSVTQFVTGWQPSSAGYAWYSWVIPRNLFMLGTNYIRLANTGTAIVDNSAVVYIKNVAVIW